MAGEGSKFLLDYCICGGAFKVTTHTTADAELAAELLTRWQGLHSGPGHAPTTPNEANMARNFWRSRPYLGHVGAPEAVRNGPNDP